MSHRELEHEYRPRHPRGGAVIDIRDWFAEPADDERGHFLPKLDRETYWQNLLRQKLARSRVSIDDRQPAELEELFNRLTAEWKRDTLVESSMSAIVLHPAYQRIIGLGQPVVPLILRELQREPYHWFWALSAITGEDLAADEGSIERATAIWLEWADHHRLLQTNAA
jgi:hypothetical protein